MHSKNNFDFIRLLFASTVIISHSFPLSGHKEIFSSWTNEQIDLGGLSVEIFFIISGYLIFNSLKFSPSALNYLWKRTIRIFPGLFFMLLFTLFVIGLLYHDQNVFSREYFTYLPRNMTLYFLQGGWGPVFRDNPYSLAINGSLWSLSYEFSMYLLMLLFFPLKKRKSASLILLYALFFLSLIGRYSPQSLSLISNVLKYIMFPDLIYKMSTYFLSGAILTFYNIKRINTITVRFVLLFILVLSVGFGVFEYFSFTLLPVYIILVALSYNKYLNYIPNKLGDISYGVYIYGFLIQQVLMSFYNFSPWTLMVLALVFTYPLAYLSWHLVEKKMQSFKNLVG